MKGFVALMHLVSGTAAITSVVLVGRHLMKEHRKDKVMVAGMHLTSSLFAFITSVIQTERIMNELKKR
jgi:hypothetical protein